MHWTWLPLLMLIVLNDSLFEPTPVPLSSQLYAGVPPPNVGVAVNVIRSPSQPVVLGDAAMVTLGVS